MSGFASMTCQKDGEERGNEIKDIIWQSYISNREIEWERERKVYIRWEINENNLARERERDRERDRDRERERERDRERSIQRRVLNKDRKMKIERACER